MTKDSGAVAESDEQMRIDLAACYRLADMHAFNEGIFNHLTVLIPERDCFLVQPIGMHWSEVRAADLLEVDFEGKVIRGDGEIELSTFFIHLPIHRAHPGARCVFHTHMPFASTLTRLQHPEILPTGQTEIRFWNRVAYDPEYTGLVYDMEEGKRLAAVLGPDRQVLMLANHGVVVTGASIAETYDRLYYLEQACRAQVYAMWTGRPLKLIPEPVIAHTTRQLKGSPRYGGKPSFDHHFDALKRILDRRSPGYAS
jgi:ribulose-5-phosphate 4-epimerase/fuculose-1-phosphate aldolase